MKDHFEQMDAGGVPPNLSIVPIENDPSLRVLAQAMVTTLPLAVKNCEGSQAEIAAIVKALAAFSTPQSFAYHIGKDLLINGVNIFKVGMYFHSI